MSEPNKVTTFPKTLFSMVNRPLGGRDGIKGFFGGKNAATGTLGTGRGIVGVQG